MANILIVEDDPNISGLYSFILKKRGFTVTQAKDAEEGLAVLDRVQPNLIILDLLMPGENGVQFLRDANLQENYPQTKVLVVSNVESADFAKQLEPFHVENYLVKAEYTPHRIADTIERILTGEKGGLGLNRLRRLFKREK